MSDVANFNERYLASVLSAGYSCADTAAHKFNVDARIVRELAKLSSRSVKSIAQSTVLIVEPSFKLADVKRLSFTNKDELVVGLNEDYLLTVRHLAAYNLRQAMLVSKMSKEMCETILTMSMHELRQTAKTNRLLCSCVISSQALQRTRMTNMDEFKGLQFLKHLPMLSFA